MATLQQRLTDLINAIGPDIKSALSTLTTAAVISPVSDVYGRVSGRRLREAQIQGMIDSNTPWRVQYNGTSWPALSTVPQQYRDSGKPIYWISTPYVGVTRSSEMRPGVDYWIFQVS